MKRGVWQIMVIMYVTYVQKGFLDSNFKGTGHDFCWSENPIYHLQKQGNILYISKQIKKTL